MTATGETGHPKRQPKPSAVLSFRSRTQVLLNVGVFGLFVLIAVGTMAEDGQADLAGILFATAASVLAARSLPLRVVATSAEVRVHSWWRTRRFAREDVADLRFVPYDGMWVRMSESPTWTQLRLTTQDGHEHDLKAVITLASTRKAQLFSDTVMGRERRLERGPARHLRPRT